MSKFYAGSHTFEQVVPTTNWGDTIPWFGLVGLVFLLGYMVYLLLKEEGK